MDVNKSVFGVFVSIVLSGVAGDLVVKPENTAGDVGSHVVLKCQGSNPEDRNRYTWFEVVPGGSNKAITEDDFVYEEYRQHYSVLGNHEAFEYNLNISLQASTSGPYQCNQLRPVDDGYAYVITLGEPACGNNISGGVVMDGETVRFTCDVDYYNGSPTDIDWPPVINWPGAGNVNVERQMNSGTVTSHIDIVANRSLDGAVFTATIQFEEHDEQRLNYATNTPTYTKSVDMQQIVINYPPENIEVAPESDSYSPGDIITCTADSRPPPDYHWLNRVDNSAVNGAELTITEGMVDGSHTYACEASSTIRGQVYSITSQNLTFTVTTTTAATTTPTTASDPTTNNAVAPTEPGGSKDDEGLSTGAIIGIAVGAAVLVIIVIVIVVYFLCCRKRKEIPSAPKSNPQMTMSKIHGDQVRQPSNGAALEPGAMYPDGSPPPYQTWDKSQGSLPHNTTIPPNDPRHQNVDGVVYADLALDDTPRSRKPIQVFETTEYAEVQRV